MTRDIFDTPFGDLDIIVAVVLIKLGLQASLNTWTGVSPDQMAADNAARFIEYYGDRRIAAIKQVREVTGLSLRDAKDAVVQVYETYQTPEHFAALAIEALREGRYRQAHSWTAKAAGVQEQDEGGW